ncbi:MAG: DUF2945 domain-containing protein [Pseudobdellovibrio sp.]
MKHFKKNSKVYWKWLGRKIPGHIVDVYFEPTVQTIKGKSIKRNGSKECPAYLVESQSGNQALKLHTEIFQEVKDQVARRPQIFSEKSKKKRTFKREKLWLISVDGGMLGVKV